ncbi:hypothetical protein FKW77_002437 [Venturia effusa]|uniref:Uncharacterized protein n=1 Tax=Venturia effusa TaxID=50376 RepID=A0A517L8T4_9PEZI|nr:hypothetical protein FKW77_002437 [Venturia effusa]
MAIIASILQVFQLVQYWPYTSACLLSFLTYLTLLGHVEQAFPRYRIQSLAEEISVVTFYQFFVGVFCIREAFSKYVGGRTLCVYSVFAPAHFGGVYLAITAVGIKIRPLLFESLGSVDDWLQSHNDLLTFIIIVNAAYYFHRYLEAADQETGSLPNLHAESQSQIVALSRANEELKLTITSQCAQIASDGSMLHQVRQRIEELELINSEQATELSEFSGIVAQNATITSELAREQQQFSALKDSYDAEKREKEAALRKYHDLRADPKQKKCMVPRRKVRQPTTLNQESNSASHNDSQSTKDKELSMRDETISGLRKQVETKIKELETREKENEQTKLKLTSLTNELDEEKRKGLEKDGKSENLLKKLETATCESTRKDQKIAELEKSLESSTSSSKLDKETIATLQKHLESNKYEAAEKDTRIASLIDELEFVKISSARKDDDIKNVQEELRATKDESEQKDSTIGILQAQCQEKDATISNLLFRGIKDERIKELEASANKPFSLAESQEIQRLNEALAHYATNYVSKDDAEKLFVERKAELAQESWAERTQALQEQATALRKQAEIEAAVAEKSFKGRLRAYAEKLKSKIATRDTKIWSLNAKLTKSDEEAFDREKQRKNDMLIKDHRIRCLNNRLKRAQADGLKLLELGSQLRKAKEANIQLGKIDENNSFLKSQLQLKEGQMKKMMAEAEALKTECRKVRLEKHDMMDDLKELDAFLARVATTVAEESIQFAHFQRFFGAIQGEKVKGIWDEWKQYSRAENEEVDSEPFSDDEEDMGDDGDREDAEGGEKDGYRIGVGFGSDQQGDYSEDEEF